MRTRTPPYLGALLLVLLVLRLESLLVADELLLHEQVVLDALLLEQPEAALGVRRDGGQLVGGVGALRATLLLPHAGRHRGLVPAVVGSQSLFWDILMILEAF